MVDRNSKYDENGSSVWLVVVEWVWYFPSVNHQIMFDVAPHQNKFPFTSTRIKYSFRLCSAIRQFRIFYFLL